MIGPRDSSKIPRFAGPPTFALLPRIEEVARADIVVVGIPFDSGVSYRPGARFGPAHVRESSRLLRPFNPVAGIFPFEVQQVVDGGDLAVNPFSIEEAVQEIEERADGLTTKGARLMAIGGDHTIALPLLRSVAKKHGPVAVVHFDAHLDTWSTYFGAPVTHGTPFRRASEEGLIDMNASVHIGIRGPLYSQNDLMDDQRLGFSVIASHEIERNGLQHAISRLHKRIEDRPVYVSVDIDVLDPAYAPGTGTPEAGGLTSRELLEFIRALGGHRVVGADVVEVAPVYDHAQITGIAAAHVAYELITAMAFDPPVPTYPPSKEK